MEIFVTPRAEQNFNAIVDQIKERWGEKTGKEFIQKVDEIFKLLKNYPLMGQVEKDDIRGFQLSPQTRVLSEYVTIGLLFFHSLTFGRTRIKNLVRFSRINQLVFNQLLKGKKKILQYSFLSAHVLSQVNERPDARRC